MPKDLTWHLEVKFSFLIHVKKVYLFPWSETSKVFSWVRLVLGSQGQRRRTGPGLHQQIATASSPSPSMHPTVPALFVALISQGVNVCSFLLSPSSVRLQESMKRVRL